MDTPILKKKWKVVDIEKTMGLPVEKASNLVKSSSLSYMRFFIHVIDDNLFKKILSWSNKWIAIEVRSDKNRNEYKTFKHKRYYRSSSKLLRMILDFNFEIIYFIESKGLAKFKKEDPTIIRIIAKKIINK
jgi:hypothetical protein